MGDSVAPACVNVIPDAADTAFQIHRMKRSAYTAVLRSFSAQSDLLSGAKEECLAQLRKELKILETEHGEYLVEAKSNKHMKSLSSGMSEGSTHNNEVTKDTPDRGSTVPDGDTVFQIHCLERSAYASVLRAFGAVTNHLSWLQVKLLAKLRNELRVSHIEHKEVLAKVISDEHIKSLRKFCMANYSVVMKMDAAFHAQAVVRDKITSTEQLSTSSTNCLSLAQKSQIPERSMPSIRDNGILDSSSGAKEHLSTSSTSCLSLAQKYPIPERSMASIRDNVTLDSSSGAKEQLSTSSTICLSLAQKSPAPERSTPYIRDSGILYSYSGAKEESCFESHVAKRLRSVCELTLAYLECLPSVEQLPAASNSVMAKGSTDDTLDRETLSCEVKAGCTISSIFQEKHSQSNAGQVPSCVDDHRKQESRKRKTEVPVMRGSKSRCVIDRTDGIYYKEQRNKDSNLEHGSEIFKIRLTANLLNKVEKIFKENPDPANFDTVKSMLKAHEKDLLDALAELSEVSKDEAYNGQLAKVINHHEMPPRSASPTVKTPPEITTTNPSANSTVILQAPPRMETLPHAAVSPPSAPAVLTQKRRADAPPPPRQPDKRQRPRVKKKYTVEQEQRRVELAHHIQWAGSKTTGDSAAVEAFCAEAGISPRTLSKLMNHYNSTVIPRAPPQTETLPQAAVPTQSSSVELPDSLTAVPPPSPRKESCPKFTAEQTERMQEFVHRVGWAAHKTDSVAVDAFCAQHGIPRDAFMRWTCQKRRADAPPPLRPPGKKQQPPRIWKKYTAEQEQRRLELAHRVGWAAPKTTDDSAAVVAFCAQVGISRRTFLQWMSVYKRRYAVMKILTPPPPAGAAHE